MTRGGRRRRAWALLTAWIVVFGVVAPARAQQPSPQKEEEQPYFLHMTNGIRLFNSNDFAAAIAEFEAAYAAKPSASPLLNEALSYRELKKYPQAVVQLERALAQHGSQMSEDDKAGAKRAIEEMRALFAYLSITITPKEARAKVSVDGDAIPPEALAKPVAVSLGEHLVVVTADGFLEAEKRLSVVSTDRVTVDIALAPKSGKLRVVAAHPDTKIVIDGVAKSPGSWEGQLPAGTHSVRAEGETGEGTIEIAAGGSVVIDLTKGNGPLPPLPKPAKVSKRGFYAHANGAVLFPAKHPKVFENHAVSSGGYVGARAGYRVHEYAAFEGLGEYGNVEGPANGAGEETYSLSSIRAGVALRLMSPGDLVHFVGTIGGGVSVHLMSYEDIAPGVGLDLCRDQERECSSNGVDFFAMTEVGAEIDFDHVLIGLGIALYLVGTKGMEDDPFDRANVVETLVDKPYDNELLPMVGPRLYIGYAFW